MHRCVRCGTFLLVLVAAAGCGAGGRGPRDPAFTPAALSARGLAIGGVVSAVGEPAARAQARAPLDSLLWSVLAGELRSTALAPLGHAELVLGSAGRRAALDALERYGTVQWGPDALRALPGRGDAQFLVFGRIDQAETIHDSVTHPARADAAEPTARITTRRVGATFTVYALPAGKPVWSERIVKTRSVEHRADESAEDAIVAREVFRELATQIAR